MSNKITETEREVEKRECAIRDAQHQNACLERELDRKVGENAKLTQVVKD